jgi:hypothetical protein
MLAYQLHTIHFAEWSRHKTVNNATKCWFVMLWGYYLSIKSYNTIIEH